MGSLAWCILGGIMQGIAIGLFIRISHELKQTLNRQEQQIKHKDKSQEKDDDEKLQAPASDKHQLDGDEKLQTKASNGSQRVEGGEELQTKANNGSQVEGGEEPPTKGCEGSQVDGGEKPFIFYEKTNSQNKSLKLFQQLISWSGGFFLLIIGLLLASGYENLPGISEDFGKNARLLHFFSYSAVIVFFALIVSIHQTAISSNISTTMRGKIFILFASILFLAGLCIWYMPVAEKVFPPDSKSTKVFMVKKNIADETRNILFGFIADDDYLSQSLTVYSEASKNYDAILQVKFPFMREPYEYYWFVRKGIDSLNIHPASFIDHTRRDFDKWERKTVKFEATLRHIYSNFATSDKLNLYIIAGSIDTARVKRPIPVPAIITTIIEKLTNPNLNIQLEGIHLLRGQSGALSNNQQLIALLDNKLDRNESEQVTCEIIKILPRVKKTWADSLYVIAETKYRNHRTLGSCFSRRGNH